IRDALTDTYGYKTPAYLPYAAATTLDTAARNYLHPTPIHEVVDGLRHGRERAVALLNQAARSLEEKLADLGEEMDGFLTAVPVTVPLEDISNDVFVVHGRDGPAKLEVTLLIERAGLNPVILHEQANQGRTIIEKFEDHGGAAGFAVVVLTPDDVGGPG